MKRRVIIAVILLAGSVSVWAQTVPVYHINERKPDLYYYTGNWIDSSYIQHPDSTKYAVHSGPWPWDIRDLYIGRTCVTPQPLRIIGIAGAVYTLCGNLSPYLDTTRVPEYFQLYQHEGDSIFFVGETCWDAATPEDHWDTTSPQYIFEFPRIDHYYVDIYGWYEDDLYNYPMKMTESYFDKPILVHDTFYVGGTTHNNLLYGSSEELPGGGLYEEHPRTLYYKLGIYYLLSWIGQLPYTIPPNPNYYIIKYFWPHQTHYSLTNWGGDPGIDTSQFFIKAAGALDPETDQYINPWWHLFFPIIDTNYIPGVGTYDDSCLAPMGFHLEGMNDAGVILAWNAGGETLWQLAVAKEGVNMGDGLLMTTPINYVGLESLEYGNWYRAQVRTICEDDVYGDWSDLIQFYYGDPADTVPNPDDTVTCPTPTGLQVVSTSVGKVVLQWAAGADAVSWETEVGPVGTEPGSGSVAPAPTYFTLRYGLDTATWHWARVRAKCGTDWYSLWSDTVMFYIPGDGNGSDTTTAINLVEQYTYLMPNPAREEVTVMSSFRIRSVELYGSDGKLLQTKEVNGVGTRLSLEGLPAGVYFVRVRTTAGVTTKRLVVEK